MAMDLSTISKWLDDDNTKHELREDKDLIVFGAEANIQTGHFIRLIENGEMFNYQVQIRANDKNLAVPYDHPHIDVLLKYLLHKNYTTKFGSWEYDYTDGDLRFSVEIPLEDGEITQKQFKRISFLMFRNVDTMGKEILAILETGELPEDDTSSDDLLKKLLLMRMMEDGGLDKLLGDVAIDEDSPKKPKKSSKSKKIVDEDDGI